MRAGETNHLAAVRTIGVCLLVAYVVGLAALVASNVFWAYLVIPLLVTQALFGATIGGRKLHRPLPAWRFAIAVGIWCPLAALIVMSVMLSVGSAIDSEGDLEIAFGGILVLIITIGLGVWQTWRRARYVLLWRLAGFSIVAGLVVGFLAVIFFHTVTFGGELPGLAAILGAVAGFTSAGWGLGLVAVALVLLPVYHDAPSHDHYCDNCEYDLTGTLAAGRTVCPECGSLVRRRG